MGIIIEREIARADINDEGGVTVYQETPLLELTIEQARAHARSINGAAAEAERIAEEDRKRMAEVHESSGGYPYIVNGDDGVVL